MLAADTVAHGAIYSWHDAKGITHYVYNLDNVPTESSVTPISTK
jgi:hypothetical protein